MEIHEFSDSIGSSIDLELRSEDKLFTPEFSQISRGLIATFESMKNIDSIYNNIFVALEIYKNNKYPDCIVNITDSFIEELKDSPYKIDNIDSGVEWYISEFGAYRNSSFIQTSNKVLIDISTEQAHNSTVDFLATKSNTEKIYIIIYLTSDSNPLSDEFIYTHKSELSSTRCAPYVLNVTSASVVSKAAKQYEVGLEVIGDYDILDSKLNEVIDIIEVKNKGDVSDVEVYNTIVRILTEGNESFIPTTSESTGNRYLLPALLGELILQRGKKMGLLTAKDGIFITSTINLFNSTTKEYISKCRDVYTKALTINGMSKYNVAMWNNCPYMLILKDRPRVNILVNYYCCIDKDFIDYKRYTENSIVSVEEMLNPEDVMTFEFNANTQYKNREFLVSFIEEKNIGVDVSQCVFFKRDGKTYIGFDAKLDVDCTGYCLPYDEEIGSVRVIERRLGLPQLSTLLPLKSLLYNESRIEDMIREINRYRSDKNLRDIVSTVERSYSNLVSTYNKVISENPEAVNKSLQICRLLCSKLDWSIIKSTGQKFTAYSTEVSRNSALDKRLFTTMGNKNYLSNMATNYLVKIGLLNPKNKIKSMFTIAILEEIINKKITVVDVYSYIKDNISDLYSYNIPVEDIETIKSNVGENNIIEVIQQIVTDKKILSTIANKLALDNILLISKIFLGYKDLLTDKINKSDLEFTVETFPIILRSAMLNTANFGDLGITPYKYLCNLNREDKYKSSVGKEGHSFKVMREVARFCEFNFPVITETYFAFGKSLTLQERRD